MPVKYHEDLNALVRQHIEKDASQNAWNYAGDVQHALRLVKRMMGGWNFETHITSNCNLAVVFTPWGDMPYGTPRAEVHASLIGTNTLTGLPRDAADAMAEAIVVGALLAHGVAVPESLYPPRWDSTKQRLVVPPQGA